MELRALVWVGGSKEDLKDFPDEVQRVLGRELLQVQRGDTPENAKPLRGFGGASVLELVEAFDGNAYRCVYTVRFKTAAYVLHAFQKKSHRGRRTDPRDIEMVKRRLKQAEDVEKQRLAEEAKEKQP